MYVLFPEATSFHQDPPPTHTHTLQPPPHQAVAGEFSAVCALNRPHQEQTTFEGLLSTKLPNLKFGVSFVKL